VTERRAVPRRVDIDAAAALIATRRTGDVKVLCPEGCTVAWIYKTRRSGPVWQAVINEDAERRFSDRRREHLLEAARAADANTTWEPPADAVHEGHLEPQLLDSLVDGYVLLGMCRDHGGCSMTLGEMRRTLEDPRLRKVVMPKEGWGNG
jgi:hypothetical protein